jgi:hypothetical protein
VRLLLLGAAEEVNVSRLVNWLRSHALVLVATALVGIAIMAFGSQRSSLQLDEVTVRQIHVVDSNGRERITIGGEFPPRRAELAGILFHNQEGNEAGGLVYHGKRNAEGQIEAGGLLTFDQYREDQIMILEYSHTGEKKRNGLTFADRPDEMSERLLAVYAAVEAAKSDEEREKIKAEMLPGIPPEELPARRLFVGRNIEGVSLVSLHDGAGRPRLNLEVDADGTASIVFLDAAGGTVRTITP